MLNREFKEINGITIDVTTVMDKTVSYNPTPEEARIIIDESKYLLNEYFDCLKNGDGLRSMFNPEDGTFWKAKGWLISAMQRHPAYNGRYQIILRNTEVSRGMDYKKIDNFFDYCNVVFNNAPYWYEDQGERISEEESIRRKEEYYRMYLETYDPDIEDKYRTLKMEVRRRRRDKGVMLFHDVMNVLSYNISTHLIYDILNKETADRINDIANNYDIKYRTSEGNKVSKCISKLAKIAGFDKHVDIKEICFTTQNGEEIRRTKDFGWNYQFATFADSINPFSIEATIVISVNPIDYWTMSFGKNWASCHTIDKENLRRCDNSYHGMYCGGTQSYMEDESSIIVYTLPNDWNGGNPELADKVQRCVFYLGEDKLGQSRLYPDGRDGGDASIAGSVRSAVQRVVAEIFDVPNYWTLKKNTDADGNCYRNVTESYGPHYRDYFAYNDCNMSYMKRIDGHQNTKFIKIGVPKITCPSCGTKHTTEDNIFCPRCYEGKVRCYGCGDYIYEDEAYEVDGHLYCSSCVYYCECCDEYITDEEANSVDVYDSRYGRIERTICDDCLRDNYYYSEYDDVYVPNDEVIETEEGDYFMPDSDGYGYCSDCEECHNQDELIYDEVTECYYCQDCYDALIEARENEEE